jgi:hypothetical protein
MIDLWKIRISVAEHPYEFTRLLKSGHNYAQQFPIPSGRVR